MNPMFAMLNGWEVVAILAVVLILFGAKKLPELAKGLGQGIKEFKKSSREIQDELSDAMDINAPPPARPAQTQIPAQATPAPIDPTSPAAAVTPVNPPIQPKQ